MGARAKEEIREAREELERVGLVRKTGEFRPNRAGVRATRSHESILRY
jgi:hypothetical protein